MARKNKNAIQQEPDNSQIKQFAKSLTGLLPDFPLTEREITDYIESKGIDDFMAKAKQPEVAELVELMGMLDIAGEEV